MSQADSAIFVGQDVTFYLVQGSGNNASYPIGAIKEAHVIMERTVVQYVPAGKQEPLYRRAKRVYMFRFQTAFIDTRLLRYFAGKKRGSTDDWRDITKSFEDGFGNIFDDYPDAIFSMKLYDSVPTGGKYYDHIINVKNLHPTKCDLIVRSDQVVMVNIEGYCEDAQLKEEEHSA